MSLADIVPLVVACPLQPRKAESDKWKAQKEWNRRNRERMNAYRRLWRAKRKGKAS